MPQTRVLIVDDNRAYREAFRRNLVLSGFEVREAEDSAEAMNVLHDHEPDVVVTDLAMRHPSEGLDLIRQLRSLQPDLPVIMISAVGTFDEGAEAMRLGAAEVISKSRIDEELGRLHEAIHRAARDRAIARKFAHEMTTISHAAPADPAAARAALTELMRRDDAPTSVKREAFDLLSSLTGDGDAATAPQRPVTQDHIREIEAALTDEIPGFASLLDETRQNLVTAEYLYRQRESGSPGMDFSRSIGFTYCFAVENEIKHRLRKRMAKFFGDEATVKLIQSLLEDGGRRISIFFQQYLLRSQKGFENEATIDNFHHVFLRILEHRGRYKPDGLKALGIVIVCFGRTYSYKKLNQDVKIDNPLGLKGLEESDQAMRLASLLINLQHYRNPYIHPEISEMTKLSQIRETAIACCRSICAIP